MKKKKKKNPYWFIKDESWEPSTLKDWIYEVAIQSDEHKKWGG